MATGNIADATTEDTLSANPTAEYKKQAHGGPPKTYQTIYSSAGGGTSGGTGVQIIGLDPLGTPTPVPGMQLQPLVPPSPLTLVRTPPIVGIVNSAARGVYFEGTLVPVIGDGVTGALAAPNPRLLTNPGNYNSIFIGTRT